MQEDIQEDSKVTSLVQMAENLPSVPSPLYILGHVPHNYQIANVRGFFFFFFFFF